MDDLEKTLFDAIRDGNLKEVKRLIEDEKIDVNSSYSIEGEYEGSALHCSVYCDQLDILKYLLDHGADMEQKDNEHDTVLLDAIAQTKVEMSKELLLRGADITKINDETGYNIIDLIYHIQAESGETGMEPMILDMFKFLRGADVKPAKR